MSLTAIVRTSLKRRCAEIEAHACAAPETREQALVRRCALAKDTVWGREHDFASIRSYDDYVGRVPLCTYDDIAPYVDRMRRGESGVLWPGVVKWYAQSSGTTADRSKFIPVTAQALRDTHYRGGTDAVALYLRNNPASRMFDGKSLILGGSHRPNHNVAHSLVGDLSAILIENINPLVNLARVPRKSVALLSDFNEKRERIAQACAKQKVTNISGVPSWMMGVLRRVLEITGKDDLTQVWPHLEVFFHGGVKFGPYREQYRALIPSEEMRYMETYNASEGFFGLQDDPTDEAMLLMTDYGVFYELIAPGGAAIPLEAAQTGVNYALVISTTSGLWRYQIGDTVRFTSLRPYKFVITGRTKYYINAFGEEVIEENAERALAEACRQTGAHVRDYTAAPIYMNAHARGAHQWLVDFATPPADAHHFAELLDQALQSLNSDYEAKRNSTLDRLTLTVASPGQFDRWLALHGKLGGQHKVPRLQNDRKIIDEILAIGQ